MQHGKIIIQKAQKDSNTVAESYFTYFTLSWNSAAVTDAWWTFLSRFKRIYFSTFLSSFIFSKFLHLCHQQNTSRKLA